MGDPGRATVVSSGLQTTRLQYPDHRCGDRPGEYPVENGLRSDAIEAGSTKLS